MLIVSNGRRCMYASRVRVGCFFHGGEEDGAGVQGNVWFDCPPSAIGCDH